MIDRKNVLVKSKVLTYQQIKEDVRKWTGHKIETCWIAHVKELNGFPMRDAPNRISPTSRAKPCPPEMRPVIEDSMRRLCML